MAEDWGEPWTILGREVRDRNGDAFAEHYRDADNLAARAVAAVNAVAGVPTESLRPADPAADPTLRALALAVLSGDLTAAAALADEVVARAHGLPGRAELVAAERERCAAICDAIAGVDPGRPGDLARLAALHIRGPATPAVIRIPHDPPAG